MKKTSSVLAVLFVVALGTFTYSPLEGAGLPSCSDLKQQVTSWRALAPVAFVLITASLGIVAMPRIAILLAGGLVFGFWWGLLWVMVSSLLSAAACFFFARSLGRKKVSDWVERTPKVRQFVERIEAAGFNFVVFCRLIHVVPYTPLNLTLGLLPISSRDYFLGTAVGLLPGSIPFVYFGTTLGCALLDGNTKLSPRTWWYVGGAMALLALASAIPLFFKPQARPHSSASPKDCS